MKRFLLVITCYLLTTPLFANHITGGEIFYTYVGQLANGNHQYHVTLKLYRDHFSTGAQLDGAAAMAIFNNSSNTMVWNSSITLTSTVRLILGSPGPCITNAPVVDYDVGYYEFDIDLPPSASGYTIAYQRCCRIAGINNLSGSSGVGATYTAQIPGFGFVSTGPVNNSAHFIGPDTVIVCAGYPFTYSFAAEDADTTDQLLYSFCDAFLGGGQGSGTGPGSAAPNPPASPNYSQVPYAFPYSGFSPLGSGVTINANTGLITGIAPTQGIYVVTVCVNEIRNGQIIATQRKDLQIKAGDCDVASAALNPKYVTCDGFTMNFANLSTSPLINSYFWNFGDPASGVNDTSTSPTPPHTFTAAGDYTVKLVTNRGQECSDSTTTIVGVWPGFVPDFDVTGVCLINPVNFADRSTTAYGVIDSWEWDFGDLNSTADVSDQPAPSWTYSSTGVKNVTLTVTNSKGCEKSITKQITIIDKPIIALPFADTLICVPDAVQLQANGVGNFSWTPLTNIVNANTNTPTVNPTTTTTYTVQLNDQGCVNTATVRVRVVDFVTLTARADATICLTDTIHLGALTDGLQYLWTTTSGTISDPTLLSPTAIPAAATTTYQITSRIGSCSATDQVVITGVPYPIANAGPDDTVCYNHPAFLHATHNGSSFTWSPVNTLDNANTLDPIAHPPRTMEYIFSSFANLGCPKPDRDTVLITVLPKIIPFAGHDTLVVVGQPVQFNAEGGTSYQWIPSIGLNNPLIYNPIGVYSADMDSIRYTVLVSNAAGCVDSAFIKVTVFKTNPYVYVPTGFTPNGDGLNDVVRPIAVGVKQINYFSVYNRWGQLLFKTSINGHGWDGKIKGVPQGTNVFVWMVSAIDYLGNSIFLKGTVTLIR